MKLGLNIFLLFLFLFFFENVLGQDLQLYTVEECVNNMSRNVSTIEEKINNDGFVYATSVQECDLIWNFYTRMHWGDEQQMVITFKGIKAFVLGYTNEKAFSSQKGRLIYEGFRKFDEFEEEKVKIPGMCEDSDDEKSESVDNETLIFNGHIALAGEYAVKDFNMKVYMIYFIHKSYYNE